MGGNILSCNKKLCKRLLFSSVLFCIFSVFYNGSLHAGSGVNSKSTNTQVTYVKMQQEKIITSLKNIEDCLTEKGEDKNE
jgi:hypothetical protein